MKRCAALLTAAMLMTAMLAACTGPQPAPVAAPDATLRLRQAGFHDLPGWGAADLAPSLAAFRRGCAVLAKKPDSESMGRYGGTVADWRGVCADTASAPRAFFENGFTPYVIQEGADADGLFTGYYEPQIAASRTRHGKFQAPAYGLPPDLVRADLGAFIPALKGEHISGRLEGRALKPYPDRAAIDARGAAGAPVLLYADPVDLFFLQIQGSGRVTLAEGGTLRLAYAGENGQPYTAIGKVLVAQGAMALTDVSLQSIRAWLVAHPDKARAVLESDKSYVFFREAPLGDAALGSPGTLGTQLTPLANLAVDARVHPLGAPFYVAAAGPDPVQGLLVAADTGGAIRGAVRGDIFFGFGPEAERRAGALKAPGHLFVLLPNALAAQLGASVTPRIVPRIVP